MHTEKKNDYLGVRIASPAPGLYEIQVRERRKKKARWIGISGSFIHGRERAIKEFQAEKDRIRERYGL